MSKGKLYFPGLNGLRFFAALAVLITHVEMFKHYKHYGSIWQNSIISSMGSMGVDLFFVLSGFLITYLLFTEESVSGTISLRNFYVRRILRIWPLYFFIVAITFFFLPNFANLPYSQSINNHFQDRLILYSLILPNVALALYPGIHYASMSWSIGVEEQFYIIWPFLIKFSKNRVKAITIFMIFFMALKVILFGIYRVWPHLSFLPALKEFIVMTRLECMAFGGLGAYLLYRDLQKFLRIIYNPFVQWSAVLLIFPITYLLDIVNLEDAKHWVYGLLFLIIVINTASNRQTIFQLEQKWLDFLGRISYGIYMYQYLAIILSISLITRLVSPIDSPVMFNVMLYLASLFLVIIFAFLSYQLFEKRFIALKERFSTILSGDVVKWVKLKRRKNPS